MGWLARGGWLAVVKKRRLAGECAVIAWGAMPESASPRRSTSFPKMLERGLHCPRVFPGTTRAASHPRHRPYRRPAPQPRPRAPLGARLARLGRRQGQRLRPRHRAGLRCVPRRPTASRCSTWPRPSACAPSAGAARCCCSKACSTPRDLELCSRLDLWHTVHCDEQIDMLAAHKTQVPQRVFLKMNSGMNRLGFTPERFALRLDPAQRAAAGRRDLADDALQRRRRRARHRPPVRRPSSAPRSDLPGERSIANSAATLRHADQTRGDWVRPGIVLYGSAPDFPEHDAAHWQLQPAMTLSTQLIVGADAEGRRHHRLRLAASRPRRR